MPTALGDGSFLAPSQKPQCRVQGASGTPSPVRCYSTVSEGAVREQPMKTSRSCISHMTLGRRLKPEHHAMVCPRWKSSPQATSPGNSAHAHGQTAEKA